MKKRPNPFDWVKKFLDAIDCDDKESARDDLMQLYEMGYEDGKRQQRAILRLQLGLDERDSASGVK